MRIQATRIAADLDLIAGITETPGDGSSRPTFTPQWALARDYVIGQARAAGCDAVIDPCGNVHVRQKEFGWHTPAWLSGSHIDSVPHGGKFDGVTGIVVPLEILRAAHAARRTIPLELIIFAEEEGTTFNLGMLGSRAWAGTLTMDELARLKNRDGISPLDAGRAYGVVADEIISSKIDPKNYRGLIEVHVEQGPAMWEQNIPVAIVTAINGRRQFACTVHGVANHAGSTPMSYRHDALVGFGEMAVALEHVPVSLSPHAVCTVGQVFSKPNAINVIPDEVTFTIDFRAPTDEILGRGAAQLTQVLRQIADRRELTIDIRPTEALPAVALDGGVIAALRTAAAKAGIGSIGETSSGALHDAAILAPLLATAMVFVASRDGISHNPGEFSRIEDIAQAAELLAAVVTE